MTDQLKPCPWCGEETKFTIWHPTISEIVRTTIHCENCGAMGPEIVTHSSSTFVQGDAEAKEAWNAR